MSDKLKWWGYQHIEGGLQAKRYFDPIDIQEAVESPFCSIVVGPFDAEGRDEALERIQKVVDAANQK